MTARILAVLGILILSAPGAHAGAITVSAGETVVFSFDFVAAGVETWPPYPDVRIETGLAFSSFDPAVDTCRYTMFAQPNGVGQGSSVGSCAIGTFESALEESGWLDGLLSISLTVSTGSITLDPFAFAFSAFGVDGVPITRAVAPTVRFIPEPWSIALLLTGLAVIAAQRRSRSRR